MSEVSDTVPPDVYPAGMTTLVAVRPSIVADTPPLFGMEPVIFSPFTKAVFPSRMFTAVASASEVSTNSSGIAATLTFVRTLPVDGTMSCAAFVGVTDFVSTATDTLPAPL